MSRIFAVLFAILTVASLAPARASVIEANFTGQILSGFDSIGIFGAPANLAAGTPVTFSFRYDTSLGSASAYPFLSDSLEGGSMLGVASPVTSTSVTIGGRTITTDNAGYSVVGIVDDLTMGHGFVIGGRNIAPGAPINGPFSVIAAHFHDPAFTVPSSIGSPFAIANLPPFRIIGNAPNIIGHFQYQDCANCQLTLGLVTLDSFHSRIIPAAVPLPAAGGLLMGALGAVGVLLRRRRRSAAAA